MDFDLPEYHQAIRQRLRTFLEERVGHHGADWERQGRIPSEVLELLAEFGLFGINVPERFGGAGQDTLALAVSVEELARVDGSLALTVASHNSLGLQHILTVGSEAQKEKYLPRAACGQWLAAWALTEPHAGSDSAAISTVAEREQDAWVLRGRKSFVSQGSIGHFCVVLARTDDRGSKDRGVTAFIVDRDTPGFAVTRVIGKYGCRASDTAEITLDGCRVPDTARLGGVGMAFYDAMRILDRGRIAVAAMALGIGRAAHSMALSYSARRRTFGRAISDHQSIQFKLADARMALDAAELLIQRAASWVDRQRPCAAEAAMAKLFASEAATRVCNDALQIHGGYGYTTDCDVERCLRDAKLCEIAEGTSEIQRIILARHTIHR